MPLAWFRRNPGCTPLTCWKASVNRPGVTFLGVSHPPRYANPPATTRRTPPIVASRTSVLAMPRGRRRVSPDALRWVDMSRSNVLGNRVTHADDVRKRTADVRLRDLVRSSPVTRDIFPARRPETNSSPRHGLAVRATITAGYEEVRDG